VTCRQTGLLDRRLFNLPGYPEADLTPPAAAEALVPTSVLLQRLHDEARTDHFTLGWVMLSLHTRGFGLILLLPAIVAIAPGASVVQVCCS